MNKQLGKLAINVSGSEICKKAYLKSLLRPEQLQHCDNFPIHCVYRYLNQVYFKDVLCGWLGAYRNERVRGKFMKIGGSAGMVG